ncbi:tyrosine-type recombinase/integrase [Micromonospora sp. NPDC049240]|uniref:tyrosine-type recombinase/integrase n=1 Tax=Micromonospora sp. NPDC049240 TaxID=3155151 RepID=UPI0033CD1D78
MWLTAVAAAGVEGLRFHDLRHSHVAWLLSAKEPPSLTAIQRRLGHASITVTSDRYGHLVLAVDERIAAALDAALPRSGWGRLGAVSPTQPEASSTGNGGHRRDLDATAVSIPISHPNDEAPSSGRGLRRVRGPVRRSARRWASRRPGWRRRPARPAARTAGRCP